MDIVTIVYTLFRWSGTAIVGGGLILFALACTYLIYKKIFHGKVSITKLQICYAALLCAWLVFVFCLTSLSRGSNFSGAFNIHFLSGYVNAWNHWSISELQLIIFNMLMFAPLGFLLPILWKKAEKLWVTIAATLCLTASIEVFQLLTGTGIFELDDLFHNLLGSLFGYLCIMAILVSIRKKSVCLMAILKAFVIPCAVSLALGAAVLVYKQQPYGNMDILPASWQDLSEVQLVMPEGLSGQRSTASVYKNKYAEDKPRVEQIMSGLEVLENLTFDTTPRRENENWGYLGTNANGTACRILFFFRTGEWSYTTFSDTAAQLTESSVQQLRSRYENWMKEMALLPENAVFSVQNGDTLRWDIAPAQNLFTGSGPFQQGSVMIQFDESGELANFFYQMCWNEFVATENILSEKEAYAQVEAGNFEQYVPFQPEDTLYIESCNLVYLYDTKGFYQPVYEFIGYVNHKENLWTCQIPALS